MAAAAAAAEPVSSSTPTFLLFFLFKFSSPSEKEHRTFLSAHRFFSQ
jgi:hypothetical protein